LFEAIRKVSAAYELKHQHNPSRTGPPAAPFEPPITCEN
jgi:hypothetical protein